MSKPSSPPRSPVDSNTWFVELPNLLYLSMFKPLTRLLLCFILLFYGCAPGIHFRTPNDVYKEKIVLWLNDKSKVAGQISVSLEMNISMTVITYPTYVEFTPEGSSETKHINFNDITGYSFGADFYALKQVDVYLDGIPHLLFVKRLTAEDSKLQLYELFESGRGNPTGETRYTYFLSLPSSAPLETINTRSSSLVPNFNLKMSKIVEDCRPLANKILAKEKGYYLPQMALASKKYPEVLLRIVKEYNSCQ
jgi:hypothetical protein